MKPFTEIATDLGLAVKNRSGGVIVDDFDNDGYLDIINSAWGMDDPLHFSKTMETEPLQIARKSQVWLLYRRIKYGAG